MGHLVGSKGSILRLIDRLNKYPIGLVDSEKLRRILELLFSEEEALVASRFPLQETTLNELSRATGIECRPLETILEGMAEKGLVMDLPYGEKTFYLLMPGLIGFFEFTFMKQREDLPQAELAKLMSDYLFDDPEGGQAREFFGSKTPLTRSLTYDEQLPLESNVTPYLSAQEIIRNADYGAVGLCYCRHKKEHQGESCDKSAPVEGVCISLGTAARFMVRRGFAEQKTTEELLAVLALARQHNLTHITDNIRHKPAFICNCCSCCCELLAGVQHGYPEGVGKSPFMVEVDTERCSSCGRCLGACNVLALSLASECADSRRCQLRVDIDRCLGCGACISPCKHGALRLVEVERPLPPLKKKDLMVRILKEKGRLRPYLVSGLKKRVRRLFPGG